MERLVGGSNNQIRVVRASVTRVALARETVGVKAGGLSTAMIPHGPQQVNDGRFEVTLVFLRLERGNGIATCMSGRADRRDDAAETQPSSSLLCPLRTSRLGHRSVPFQADRHVA